MINSVQNPLIKHMSKLQDNRSYRYEQKQVVIEGIKIIKEVKNLQKLLVTDEKLIPESIQAKEIILVSDEVMNKISRTKTPEGIAAIVQMPPSTTLEGKTKILALDGINDPGNLGTLIRTACSFGWNGVYLIKNCCDPFNEKALRSAKGATFRVSLGRGNLEDFCSFIEKNPMQILIGELSGIPPENVKPSEKRLLILGSEANGVSLEIASLGQNVSLPMKENMESLNVAVAGGILMYML